jgi:hypothetical protein
VSSTCDFVFVDAFPYTTSSNQVDHLQESDLNMEQFPDSQPSYLQLYLLPQAILVLVWSISKNLLL